MVLDCQQLRAVVAEERGVWITTRQAESFWEWYSEWTYCASWLKIPKADVEVAEAFDAYVDFLERHDSSARP